MNAKRYLLGILVGIALLGGALAAVAYTLLDPVALKPRIVRLVQEATGRPLRIDGDLRITFFPWLGVAADNVELGNPSGFEGAMIRARHARMSVRLASLVRSRIEVGALRLEGVELRMLTNSAGKSNWDFDHTRSGEAAKRDTDEASDAEEAASREARERLLAALTVEKLEVRDGVVVWSDAQTPTHVTIRDVQFALSGFGLGRRCSVTGEALLVAPGVRMALNLSAAPLIEAQALVLDNARVAAEIRTPSSLAGERMALDVSARVDMATDMVDIARLRVEALGCETILQGRLRGVGAKFQGQGRVRVASCSPREVFRRLGRPLGATDQDTLSRLTLDAELRMAGDALNVTRLDMNVDNATLRAQGTARLLDTPEVQGTVRATAVDLDRYLQAFAGSSSTAGAEGSASDTPGANASDSRSSFAQDSTQTPSWLRGALTAVRAEIVLAVEELRIAKARVSDLRAQVRVGEGRARVTDMTMAAYAGTVRGNAGLDVRKDIPETTVAVTAAGVQVGPLVRDVRGREYLSGTLDASATLRSSGLNAARLRRALNGTARLSVVDGAVRGIDIPDMLRDEVRRKKGEAPTSEQDDATRFSRLSASTSIVNGLASSRDVAMRAPLFHVDGGGQAHLVRETLDFQLLITVRRSSGQENDLLALLRSVPLRVTGTFSHPQVVLDVPSLLWNMGKDGGTGALEVIEDVGSGINEGARKFLRGLFR